MVQTGSYNSKNISLTIGTKSLEAFSKDSNVETDKVDDDVSVSNGLNGDRTVNENNSTEYTINFSLKPESEDNQYCRGLQASKTLFPCLYKNKNSGETTSYSGCRFVKPAPKIDGVEVGARTWAITGSGKEVL